MWVIFHIHTHSIIIKIHWKTFTVQSNIIGWGRKWKKQTRRKKKENSLSSLKNVEIFATHLLCRGLGPVYTLLFSAPKIVSSSSAIPFLWIFTAFEWVMTELPSSPLLKFSPFPSAKQWWWRRRRRKQSKRNSLLWKAQVMGYGIPDIVQETTASPSLSLSLFFFSL